MHFGLMHCEVCISFASYAAVLYYKAGFCWLCIRIFPQSAQAVLISSFSASHIRLPAGVASVDVAETNGAAVMLCCMFRVSSTMHPERRGVL